MIDSLYDTFKHWSKSGSVWIISDTHFDDEDCTLMDPKWIDPEVYIKILKTFVHKNDTLIHLGDVGNPEYLKQLKCYKVLVMGNHDQSVEKYKPYFDEVYKGPLFISDRILLSHEPVLGYEPMSGADWLFNIHGHNHSGGESWNAINLAANVVNYMPFNLGVAIKNGMLSSINNIHRHTIDKIIKEV